MGIDYLQARMLFEARLNGASFTDTLTVAHLCLYLHPHEAIALQQLYYANGYPSVVRPLESYLFGEYSDEFLRTFLGASSVAVLDYSSYEGATILHDLNRPVSETLWGRFDAIIDAGSLEHVFNVPVAIANLMKMLKIGGRLFISSPCNNLCGHGFYQFSPELMFRVFAQENGFELSSVVFVEATFPSVELTPYRRAYTVADPKAVETRVGLVSKRPVMMIVEAQKTADVPLFAEPPLQSDYVTVWNLTKTPSSRVSAFEKALRAIFETLPTFLQSKIRGYRQLKAFSFSNERFYRRITP